MGKNIYVDLEYLENKTKPFINEINKTLIETISIANNILEKNNKTNSYFQSELINIRNQISIINDNIAERKNIFESIIENYKNSNAMVVEYIENIAKELNIDINNKKITGTIIKSDNIKKKNFLMGIIKEMTYASSGNGSTTKKKTTTTTKKANKTTTTTTTKKTNKTTTTKKTNKTTTTTTKKTVVTGNSRGGGVVAAITTTTKKENKSASTPSTLKTSSFTMEIKNSGAAGKEDKKSGKVSNGENGEIYGISIKELEQLGIKIDKNINSLQTLKEELQRQMQKANNEGASGKVQGINNLIKQIDKKGKTEEQQFLEQAAELRREMNRTPSEQDNSKIKKLQKNVNNYIEDKGLETNIFTKETKTEGTKNGKVGQKNLGALSAFYEMEQQNQGQLLQNMIDEQLTPEQRRQKQLFEQEISNANSIENVSLANEIMEQAKKVGATTGNIGLAFTKGIAEGAGSLLDAGTLLGTGALSLLTGVTDLVGWSFNENFDWDKSLTSKMWQYMMDYVQEDYVNQATNYIYENVDAIKNLNDKSFVKKGDTAYGITEGLGQIAFIAATGGVVKGAELGGTAIGELASGSILNNALTNGTIAATNAMGKYTGEFWNKEKQNANGEEWKTIENWGKGLLYGATNGTWEGVQWGVGTAINGLKVAANELINAATRVSIDTAFNALDTPARTAMDVALKDKTWSEAWEEQGGWLSLFINTGVGLLGSSGGELIQAGMRGKVAKTGETSGTQPRTSETGDAIENVKAKVNEINTPEKITKFVSDNPEKFKSITTEEQMKKIVEDTINGKISIKELEEMSNLEVSQYLSQNYGVFIDLTNPKDIAEFFNDPKLYIKSIIEEKKNIEIEINDGKKLQTADSLYKKYKKYLSDDEKEVYERLLKNQTVYTDEEEAILTAFAASGGPAMEAYLRNTKTYFANPDGYRVGLDGTDFEEMNMYFKAGFSEADRANAIKKGVDVREIKNTKDLNDFVDVMDDIIEKSAPLSDNIVVYRNVQGVYLDGKCIMNIEPGTIFNDNAFLSTSLDGKAYEGRNCQLELELPKGTKCAYIEGVCSAYTDYAQNEVILPRNSSFEVTDVYSKDAITYVRARLMEN